MAKLNANKRTGYFGMIKPTLERPDMVIEKQSIEDGAKRSTKYLFIKTFVKPDGSRVVHFESVTVRKDEKEVSISSHEVNAKSIKKEVQNGKILYLNDKLSLGSEGYLTETPNERPDLVPTSDNSKGSTKSAEKQEGDGKVLFREVDEDGGDGVGIDVQAAIDSMNMRGVTVVNSVDELDQSSAAYREKTNDDAEVYVIDGNVEMMSDGTMVDKSKSDSSIIVKDAITGDVKMIDVNDIMTITDSADAADLKKYGAEQIRQQMAQEAADKINATLNVKPGEIVTISDSMGGLVDINIVGASVDANGNPIQGSARVRYADGTEEDVAIDVLQQLYKEGVDIQAQQQITQQPTQTTEPQQPTQAYNVGDVVTLYNDDGTTATVRVEHSNDDTQYLYTILGADGKEVGVEAMSKDEFEKMAQQPESAIETPTEQPITEQPTAELEQPSETPTTQQPSTEASEEVPTVEQSQPTATERVPKDDKGNPMYEQTDADTAYDAIVEQTGGDVELADRVIAAKIDAYKKEVEKAQKAIVKPINLKADAPLQEYMAEGQKRQKALADAQAAYDAWQKIAAVPQQRITEAERQAAESRGVAVERAEAEKIAREAREEQGAEPTERVGGTSGDSREGGTSIQNNISEKKEVTQIDPRTMPDEEKARRGDMLRNAEAIPVEKDVIVRDGELSARKVAEAWWDANVGGPVFYETEAGEVEIAKSSIKDSLSHGYNQAKLDALTSLSEGFRNATYLGSLPDFERPGVLNHYFAYPIFYDGQRRYVFCRAMDTNNKNKLYVHEVFLEEAINKSNTLQTIASASKDGELHGGIALYRAILKNVLDGSRAVEPNPSASKGSANSAEKQANAKEKVADGVVVLKKPEMLFDNEYQQIERMTRNEDGRFDVYRTRNKRSGKTIYSISLKRNLDGLKQSGDESYGTAYNVGGDTLLDTLEQALKQIPQERKREEREEEREAAAEEREMQRSAA